MRYTINNIERLPLSYREQQNENRNRKGFYVFLSRFFLDFGHLETHEKHDYLAEKLKEVPGVAAIYAPIWDEEASFDSTDSTIVIRMQDIMKAACMDWRESSEAIKLAWQRRADFLNTLPVFGRLEHIDGSRNDLENNTIEAIFLDWKYLSKRIQSSIKNRGRNDVIAAKTYMFGKEEVQIQSQTYRKLALSTLLRYQLFGKVYEKVANYVVAR